jgi:tetratricopeptide (TPR) repeat protein
VSSRRRANTVLRESLAVLLLLTCLPADAAAKWTRVRSPNFLFIGEASEGRIRRTAERLERFREMLARVLPGAAAVSSAPTVVVVFPDNHTFAPFVPLGRSSDLVGYSVSWEDVNYIAMNAGRAELADSIVFHEYTHLLMGDTLGDIPLWVSEGLAELYATFRENRDGTGALIGAGRGYHLSLLRSRTLIPVAKLIAIDDKSPEYDESTRRGMLYAQSWALMHYLTFGTADRQSQLTTYLANLRTGQPSLRAFVEAFGSDFDKLDEELRQYVRLFSLPSTAVEFSERIDLDTSLRGEEIDDLEGHSYLGDLLVRVGRMDDARRHLTRIIDRAPTRARAIAAMGLIELESGRVEAAVALLQRATALSPEDAGIWSMLGRALVTRVQQLPRADDQFTATLGQARNALERATMVDASAAHTFAMLGYVILLSGADPALAVSHVAAAVRMAPAREAYRMRLAEALLRDRQFERASAYLGPLAERARSPEIREAARKLLATVVQRQLDAR